MKITKVLLSWVLTICLLITPFSGSIVFALDETGPSVSFNIAPYASITGGDSVSVSYDVGASSLASCKVSLEGTVLSTSTDGYSFTPGQVDATDGIYTLVAQATDTDGNTTIETLPFIVDDNKDRGYELTEDGISSASGDRTKLYDVNELGFDAGYGTSADGTIHFEEVNPYLSAEDSIMRYKLEDGVSLSSVAGIPYQTFDLDLEGATEGRAAVYYSGSTKEGERMAVKVYNPTTESWDTIGTFIGTGTVSEAVDIATYNDNGKIHVAAMLDYATNGSNTIIWSTDPQHYTKFEDLNDYYYKVYQYAAEQYVEGNAGYIMTTGDLVDDRPTSAAAVKQWEVSNKAMEYVEAVGMPNGLAAGNHDVGDNKKPDYSSGMPTCDYSKFLEYYNASRYNTESWYGGSLNNNISHYDLITIGNVDFLVMYLGYGLEATEETIAWANDVLQTYPHRTAIVATHEYLAAGAAIRSTTSRAQLIFDKIVDPNPNVKVVICGHDDGSLCLEKTASDGRTVYEVLSDYQFVEAEDPDFYENEHYIGTVPHCCGDGYIRLMTVEGDTLSSVTYSPITGRYNPYGDRENVRIDLDCGAADREFTTYQFSAGILLNETTEPQGDWIGAVEPIHYELLSDEPDVDTDNPAATPSNPYYAHAASAAPEVESKVDVLNAIGLSNGAKVTGWASYGNNALNLNIDLNTTPYLYYSVTQPADSNFCFSLYNNSNLSPWLMFRDATGEGAYLNSGSGNWDAYTQREQYITTSETACIDMRQYVTETNTELKWILNQVTFYNSIGKDVTVDYMFFGSAPVEKKPDVDTDTSPATPSNPYYAHAASAAPEVESKVDVLNAIGLSNGTKVTGWAAYGNSALNLNIDLNTTPYLYYSVTQPADSNFCFAFINNSNLAPWIVFRDATGEGAYLNNGNDNWNSYANREQYITTSETACIDMRQYVTETNTELKWILNQVTFYNSIGKDVTVDYMFFGSAPVEKKPDVETPALATYNAYSPVQYAVAPEVDLTPSGVNRPVDQTPYLALYDEASEIDLSLYTDETAQALKEQLEIILPTVVDWAMYSEAYVALAEAVGALELYVEPIDKDTLTSVHNYDFALTKWRNTDASVPITSTRSYITATATEAGGIRMEKSTVATNDWPSAYSTETNILLKPVNGKIYVDLDVNADSAWCIYLEVQQGSKASAVRLNFAIEHAFNSITTDGFQGHFDGVYDVTEAFTANGFDTTATMTITRTLLYIVPGGVTYDYMELLTETSNEPVDTSELEALIDSATKLDESLYTPSTWAALEEALPQAQAVLDDATATQSDINLAVIELQYAIDRLKLLADIIVEPEGSLIPGDEGLWVPNIASAMDIYRNEDKYTVLQNTNSQWPYADYTYDEAMEVTVADHQILFDITVDSATNILINADNQWISLSQYISAANTSGEDLGKGTYVVGVPLSSITQLKGKDTVYLSQTRVYAVGEAASSAVTIRQMQIGDYVAPPPVEDTLLDFMPETMDDTTTTATAGSHELVKGDLVIHSDATDGYRMQIVKEIELYDLTKLNAIRMNVDSDVPFKMAFYIKSSTDETSQWFNTSSYTDLYTVENDRVAAGTYDVYLDILSNTTTILDKSSVYMVSVTIVTDGEGTLTLKNLEALHKDLYKWPDGITYGDAATPDHPYYQHCAKEAPRVAEKVDLLKAINLAEHPTITGWVSYGNQTLNLNIDISKTPYLYYSVAVPEGSNFCFGLFNNSSYSPWLMFRDATGTGAYLNQGNATWDAYTNREQYITTSETGCIDMRPYLTNPNTLKWIVNAISFYNSTGKSDVVSYLFFGSAPLPEQTVGDLDNSGGINMQDALELYSLVNGVTEKTEENLAYADVNNDGKVDMLDALLLYNIASGVLSADIIDTYYADAT